MSEIDTEKIKEPHADIMCRSIRKGLDGFYSDPENRRRFEEWKKAREEKYGRQEEDMRLPARHSADNR